MVAPKPGWKRRRVGRGASNPTLHPVKKNTLAAETTTTRTKHRTDQKQWLDGERMKQRRQSRKETAIQNILFPRTVTRLSEVRWTASGKGTLASGRVTVLRTTQWGWVGIMLTKKANRSLTEWEATWKTLKSPVPVKVLASVNYPVLCANKLYRFRGESKVLRTNTECAREDRLVETWRLILVTLIPKGEWKQYQRDRHRERRSRHHEREWRVVYRLLWAERPSNRRYSLFPS